MYTARPPNKSCSLFQKPYHTQLPIVFCAIIVHTTESARKTVITNGINCKFINQCLLLVSNTRNPTQAEMIYVFFTHCHHFTYIYATIFCKTGDSSKVRLQEIQRQISFQLTNISSNYLQKIK